VVTIADFEVGVDKISVESGFFNVSSPALSTLGADGLVPARNSIGVYHSGGNSVVHLSGQGAGEYLEIQLTGVTTISISDFEILV
jgi:hypothetical protein